MAHHPGTSGPTRGSVSCDAAGTSTPLHPLKKRGLQDEGGGGGLVFPLSAQGLFSALSGSFSFPLLRLRVPNGFVLPFMEGDPRVPTLRVDSQEGRSCCEDISLLLEQEKARERDPLPSWGSLLVPTSQGDEAGPGAPLVLDEEGRYLPVHCERVLLLSSLGLSLNPILAFYFGCMYMGYMSLALFFTSVLHWSRPRLGWRRALDLFVARVVVLSFALAALMIAPAYVCAVYMWGFALVLGLHALGWHFARKRQHLAGTLCHVGLHFVGTASNFVFFSAVGDYTQGVAPFGWDAVQ